MKRRVLLQDSAQDRKQRMFIYILAFVAMTFTLGIFAWGHDAAEENMYIHHNAYYCVVDCDTSVDDEAPNEAAVCLGTTPRLSIPMDIGGWQNVILSCH